MDPKYGNAERYTKRFKMGVSDLSKAREERALSLGYEVETKMRAYYDKLVDELMPSIDEQTVRLVRGRVIGF